MPVRRLRSLQEAEDSVWLDRDDPRLASRIRALWRLSGRLNRRKYPPGCHRYKSIEELNRQVEAWEAAPPTGS
jgi:hypothetical protein